MGTLALLSFSEFDFDVEPINEPRLNGFLLVIQFTMNICLFIIKPVINTFQKEVRNNK